MLVILSVIQRRPQDKYLLYHPILSQGMFRLLFGWQGKRGKHYSYTTLIVHNTVPVHVHNTSLSKPWQQEIFANKVQKPVINFFSEVSLMFLIMDEIH